MSWLKLDDGFADHPKVLELSDAAFRLHVRAMCWCARQETDGVLSKAALASLGSKQKIADELVKAGLWKKRDSGHEVHDFLKYNPSRAQREAERAATRARAQRFRNGVTNAAPNAESNAVTNGVTNRTPGPTPPVRGEDPPTPLAGGGQRKPANEQEHIRRFERVYGQNAGPPPGERPDVLRVFEAYKQAFGLTGRTFRGPHDDDAYDIAAAIDAHSETEALLVAKHAKFDGMVTGRDDEKRAKHESIRYIFGNENTFARILRDGTEREEQERPDESPEAKISRLKRRSSGAA
jgi:hypothetical protein